LKGGAGCSWQGFTDITLSTERERSRKKGVKRKETVRFPKKKTTADGQTPVQYLEEKKVDGCWGKMPISGRKGEERLAKKEDPDNKEEWLFSG